MTEPTQPGAQPKEDEQKKAAVTSTSHSGPEHQTHSSNASFQQDGPVSDAGPAQGDDENPDDEFFRQRQQASEEAKKYAPQASRPETTGATGEDWLANADRLANDWLKYHQHGESPKVVAPNLKFFQEIKNNTDKALADDFLRRYQHLFCNGGGATHVYLPSLGRWTQN